MMCRPHSARFSTRRAIPSGWTARRSTFTGGSSSAGEAPAARKLDSRIRRDEVAGRPRNHGGVRHVALDDLVERVAHRSKCFVVDR